MLKPVIVIHEPKDMPLAPFPLRHNPAPTLSERMGWGRREVPAWAKHWDWQAEDDE